jgi:hypothetical protein
MIRSRTAMNHMPRYHGSGAGAGAAVLSASGALKKPSANLLLLETIVASPARTSPSQRVSVAAAEHAPRSARMAGSRRGMVGDETGVTRKAV